MLKFTDKEFKILGILFFISSVISFFYFGMYDFLVEHPFFFFLSLIGSFARWLSIYIILRMLYKFCRAMFNSFMNKFKNPR